MRQDEKAASTACCYTKSSTGIGVGVGVADAHEVRHPIIAHNSCIWGGVLFFSFFFFPCSKFGAFWDEEGREHGAHACTGGIGCVGVDLVWENSAEDGEAKIK